MYTILFSPSVNGSIYSTQYSTIPHIIFCPMICLVALQYTQRDDLSLKPLPGIQFHECIIFYFIKPHQGILICWHFFAITNNVINHFTHVRVYHQEKFIEVKLLGQRMWTVYILIDHYICSSIGKLTTNPPIQFGQTQVRLTPFLHHHQPFHLWQSDWQTHYFMVSICISHLFKHYLYFCEFVSSWL